MNKRFSRQKGVLMAEGQRHAGLSRLAPMPDRRAVLMGFVAVLPTPLVLGQGIGLSDEIIADPNSGAALFGFDPVAYFLEHRAILGRSATQTIFAGRVWYFVSKANQAAFEASPKSYLPAFGGHDPLGVAAGFAVAGNPETFAIAANRLMLFRDDTSRAALLREPARLDLADRNWPLVRRDMVP
jgi:hypothetical protein